MSAGLPGYEGCMGRGWVVASAGQWPDPQLDRHTAAWLFGLAGEMLLLCSMRSGTLCTDVSCLLPKAAERPSPVHMLHRVQSSLNWDFLKTWG